MRPHFVFAAMNVPKPLIPYTYGEIATGCADGWYWRAGPLLTSMEKVSPALALAPPVTAPPVLVPPALPSLALIPPLLPPELVEAAPPVSAPSFLGDELEHAASTTAAKKTHARRPCIRRILMVMGSSRCASRVSLENICADAAAYGTTPAWQLYTG
jgi:hypothetical protein